MVVLLSVFSLKWSCMRVFLHLMGDLAGGGRLRVLFRRREEGCSVGVSRRSSVVGEVGVFVDSLACLNDPTLCSMRWTQDLMSPHCLCLRARIRRSSGVSSSSPKSFSLLQAPLMAHISLAASWNGVITFKTIFFMNGLGVYQRKVPSTLLEGAIIWIAELENCCKVSAILRRSLSPFVLLCVGCRRTSRIAATSFWALARTAAVAGCSYSQI